MQTGNIGMSGSADRYINKVNANVGYRDYLQSVADSNQYNNLVRNEAQALLNVVGNDGIINPAFRSDPYKYTGTKTGHVTGQINPNMGYGPEGLSDINGLFMSAYNTARSGNTGGATSAGNTSSNRASSQDLALYDASIDALGKQFGVLDDRYAIGKSNLDKQYGIKSNEIDSSYTKGEKTYGDDTTTNKQDFRTSRNNIADVSSQGLRGLLRQLGAYGIGGSSDVMLAGDMVKNTMDRQNADAGGTFAKNQKNLDTNWSTFKDDIDDNRKKLTDWRSAQEGSLGQSRDSAKADLASQIATARAQRAAAAGQSADAVRAAAADWNNKAAEYSRSADKLSAFNPTYDGTAAKLSTPTLDSYGGYTDGTESQIQTNQAASDAPTLALLLGLRDDDSKKQLIGY